MKKFSIYNLIIIVSCVAVVLLVSVIFGYSISNKSLVVASTHQMSSNYYCVEVGKYNEYESAQQTASQTMEQGGAGFIFYDDGFRVFASAYLTQQDAQKVAEKNNASVYELKLNSYNFSPNFSQNSNQIFKNNILCFKNCIETLNNLLLDYEEGRLDEVAVKNNCLLLCEEIALQQEKFETIFYESNMMYRYRSYLKNFKACFEKIVELDSTKIDFVRICHYQQISAMIGLKNILMVI